MGSENKRCRQGAAGSSAGPEGQAPRTRLGQAEPGATELLQYAAQKPESPTSPALLALGNRRKRPHVLYMETREPGGSPPPSYPSPQASVTEEQILLPQSSSPSPVSSSGDAGHIPTPAASPHMGSQSPGSADTSVCLTHRRGGGDRNTKEQRGIAKFRAYLFHPPLRFPAWINDVMLQW